MKGLLEEEADAEEKAMRQAASFDCTAVLGLRPKSTLQDEITEALDIKKLSAKPKRKTALFAAVAIIFTVLSISFTWVAIENKLEGSNPVGHATDALGMNKTDAGYSEMGTLTPGDGITQSDADHPELRKGKKAP